MKERGFQGLAALGLVFFCRPLFFGQTFFYRDLYLYFLPIRKLGAELLRAGEWPLWNPWLHGGMPFAADIMNSAFYPAQLLYLVLPAERALSVEIAAHVVLSSLAAYALARVLGLRPAAACVSGLVYGYCGFTLSQANLLLRLLAQPYIPLFLLFWHLFLVERRRRWLLLTLACGVLQVFAGAVESVAFTFAVALGWALVLPAERKTRLRRAGWWLAVGIGCAGLTAVQLVPGVEMVGQSQRGEGLEVEVVGTHSVDPRRLPEMVIPGFLGRVDRAGDGAYWGGRIVDSGFPLVLSLYAGLVPVALAAAAALRRSRPLDRYWSALLLLSLLLALGRLLPFFAAAHHWIPGFQLFRYPVKYLTLGILPLALLAGRGFEVLFGRDRDAAGRRPLVAAWGVAAVLLLVVLSWRRLHGFAAVMEEFFFDSSGDHITAGLQGPLLQVLGVWLGAVLIYQMFCLRARPWLPWVLVAFIAWDLTSAGAPVNPTMPADRLRQVPPVAELALRGLGDGRLYRDPPPGSLALVAPTDEVSWSVRWNQEILRYFLGAWYGLPMIYHDDINGLAPSRVMRLERAVASVPWEEKLPLLSAASVRRIVTHEDLDLPGIERLAAIENASGTPFFLYRNGFAADRARLVTIVHPAASLGEAIGAMLSPGFDPRVHAVLEGFSPPPLPPSGPCAGAAAVETVAATVLRRVLTVDSECAEALVLSEVWYPGWEARVDGRRVPLLRANAAFQAVWLEPGSHRVELRFVPRSLFWGLAVSALTLVALTVALTVPARRV